MANWFCSVFNVVCVVNVCPVHAIDLNQLTLRGLSSSLDKKMHKTPKPPPHPPPPPRLIGTFEDIVIYIIVWYIHHHTKVIELYMIFEMEIRLFLFGGY